MLVKKINCFLAAHFPLILEYASEGAFSKRTIACIVLIGLTYLSHASLYPITLNTDAPMFPLQNEKIFISKVLSVSLVRYES